MYDVIILPLAEEDILNNTDYIAFESRRRKQRCSWLWECVTQLQSLSLCRKNMNLMKMKIWLPWGFTSVITKIIKFSFT